MPATPHAILPGNWVDHLNSYRRQGVQAWPGMEFFVEKGAAKIPKGIQNAATKIPINVLSTDTNNQKPWLDRPLTTVSEMMAISCTMNVWNLGYWASSSKGFAPLFFERDQALSSAKQGDGRTGILKTSGKACYLRAATALDAPMNNGRFGDGVAASCIDSEFGDITAAADGIELGILAATPELPGTPNNQLRNARPASRYRETISLFPFDLGTNYPGQTVEAPFYLFSSDTKVGQAAEGAGIYIPENVPYDVYVLVELVSIRIAEGPHPDDFHFVAPVAAGQSSIL